MVKDQNSSNIDSSNGGPPSLDESWWEAVLAEDEQSEGEVIASVPEMGPDVGKASISRRSADLESVNWQKAWDVYKQDRIVQMHVSGFNRGGLLVNGDDLQGFVPVSHLVELPGEMSESQQEKLLSGYVECSLRLKIIECDHDRGRVVFSERAALAGTGSRNQLLDQLKPGDSVLGVVTNITDFGVFVDLGGVEGLVHVSEISWGRVRHPKDVLDIGQEIEVYVINVDRERSRVALSMKRLHPNPWETAESRYQAGQVIEATITSIVPFGAFARLEEGLDGLIHVSEMDVDGENVDPKNVVVEGQQVLVRILHVDAASQRLGLSLKVEA
jgi:small subunit ribosomal protein S1